jgi:large subunit ribosomal protein L7/L12
MKKRLVGLLMASMLCACLAGCGHKTESEEFVMDEGKMKQTETTVNVSDEEDVSEEAEEDEATDDVNVDGEDDNSTGSCSVTLTEVGPNKVKVIKVVREITGAGLKESKDLVDAASDGPIVLVEEITEEEATKIKESLEAEGATVTIEE